MRLCDGQAKGSESVLSHSLRPANRLWTLGLLVVASTLGTACSDNIPATNLAPPPSPTISAPPAPEAPAEAGEAAAEPATLERFEATHAAMGIKFTIIGYASEESVARQAVEAAFARIDELNEILSDYDPSSESMRLCHELEAGQWHEISPSLLRMLELSHQYSEQTNGAFDITVGPLTKLWRESRRSMQLPASDAVSAAREAVGWQKVELRPEPASARLATAGMQLDFGGIAQGFAADEAARILAEHGIDRCLIDASGDVVALNSPPERDAWQVAVAPIEPEAEGSVTIHLANRSVSTSGDAFQFVEIEGRRYSHLIDPRTGWPIEGRSSVTVIAENGTQADALASALSIMPSAEALAWTEAHEGVEVLIVRVVEGEVKVERSSGFDAWLAPENE